jgi:hypothetical protein
MNNKPLTLAEQFAQEKLDQEANATKPSVKPEETVEIPQFGNPDREVYEKNLKAIKDKANKNSKGTK